MEHLEIESRAKERKFDQAKQEAVEFGKEVFDLQRFAQLYDLSRDFGPAEPDGRVDFEYQYYVDYPQIRTLAEFAALMRDLDTYDA